MPFSNEEGIEQWRVEKRDGRHSVSGGFQSTAKERNLRELPREFHEREGIFREGQLVPIESIKSGIRQFDQGEVWGKFRDRGQLFLEVGIG